MDTHKLNFKLIQLVEGNFDCFATPADSYEEVMGSSLTYHI